MGRSEAQPDLQFATTGRNSSRTLLQVSRWRGRRSACPCPLVPALPLSGRTGLYGVLDHPASHSAFGVANRSWLRFERCSPAFVLNRGVGSSIEECSDIPRETEIGCMHKRRPTRVVPCIHVRSVLHEQCDKASVF